MAKKVFKIDEHDNSPARETAPAEDIINTKTETSASGTAAAEGVGQYAASQKPEKTRANKQQGNAEHAQGFVGQTDAVSSDTGNKTDSDTRLVSGKYDADLIVKNLLKKSEKSKKTAEKPAAESAPPAPETVDNASEKPAEKQSAATGESAQEQQTAAPEVPEPAADSTATEPKQKEQPPEQDSAKSGNRTKKENEKHASDLIVNSILKGEAAAVPKPPADDSEAPKPKKIFKAEPDGGAVPVDLGVVDEPSKQDKPKAEKRSIKKERNEIAPAAAAEKKQPATVVRILKGIYRVAITTFKALLLTVPFLGVIAYTNMHVDPGRLYHIDREDMFEYDIVRMLREGHNVENIDNYNERLVKREYINQMEEPVDVIIAGSSRGALITKDMLNADSMFNTSVAGGSLDDVIGFYGVLHQYDLLPQTYIIVLDPWMLNDNHYDIRYERSIGDGYYNYMTSRMGYSVDESLKEIDSIYEPGSDEPISFWDLSDDVKWNLISITYFQASIQRHFSKSTIVRPDTWPSATDSEDGESGFLRPDGSFCYPLEFRDIDAEQASNRARMSFPESIIGLEDYNETESERKQIFIDFLKCVQQDGVEVKIIIQPLSNVLVEYMKVFERYENFFKAEGMVYEIAQSLGIEITGTFDPEKLDYDMNCFYDGYHLKEEYIEKIVKPFRQ